MRERNRELQAAGLDVLAVLCQTRESVEAWLAAHPLPYPLLADADRSRAKDWGVHVRLSLESLNIARPASFVVEPEGILRYARISRHQLDPAPFDEILARS